MTDEQIVKALECCVECDTFGGECREDCPFKEVDDCTFVLRRETLDLIKRQQAEIERLEIPILEIKNFDMPKEELIKRIQEAPIQIVPFETKIRAVAIKEFAERLRDRICDSIERSLDNPNGNDYYITDVYTDIDNLVKEMTGGKVK